MKVVDSWFFMGYTFFKLDHDRYAANIQFIEVGNNRYKPEYPCDSPYCLMVKGKLYTDGKAINLVE